MNLPDGRINDADPNAMTIEQATATIRAQLNPCLDGELIDCSGSLGRVVACDIVSQMDVPSFRASAMDGYALRSSECNQPLQVCGQSLAGHPGEDHLPVQCAQRITTGARVPDDADAVVQQENITVQEGSIIVLQPPEPGLHIRNPGTDTKSGSVLLKTGVRIGPAALALLAAHGITSLKVQRKLRVAIFSTGDELVEAGDTRKSGQIHDANRALLIGMLEDSSTHVQDLGIVADTQQALQIAIDRTIGVDLIISSGGVSVGDADYVKSVLEQNGTMNLWKIAMKPGRPLTFGCIGPSRAFFGLPGNPVSAALTCLLFVKPAIDYLCGVTTHRLPPMQLPLEGNLKKNPGRIEYQRAVIVQSGDGQWSVSTTGLQDSHVLSSLHEANCLIELATDSTGASHGDVVSVYPLTHFARPAL